MSLAILAVVAMSSQAKLDPAYIIQARYPAGSIKQDPLAPGGNSESSNMPKLMTSKARLQKTLGVELTPTDAGVNVRIFNASNGEEWLRAMDGNMMGWLEALDGKDWKPIEYHMFADCGNSYHRVVLPPNYEWTFQRIVPKGNWQTQVRFVVLEKDKTVTSQPIIMSIPPTRTKLNPAQGTQWQLSMKGYPAIQPKQTG